ncbi:sodium/nucleoside cotransporter 2-like isoform X2 [Ornithodoros turicata]|uniref:sodium/nucleoside cotransporter 2-like isoform X2 n=1 Tax=Ornithodoros turicata TaxID=34597 RepID=UPI0031399B40
MCPDRRHQARHVVALTIVDGRENFSRIISLCGLVVLVLAGYVFSKECSEVDWSQVTSSLDAVYVLAFVFLRVDWGEESCHRQLVSYSADLFNSGTGVLFGPLARGINMAEHLGNASVATIAPVFTFSVLPVICCVAAMVKILYYMGVIQFLLYHMEGVLSQTTRFNACEVFYAFVTFFLGPVDSLVLLYPYFDTLTASNLHCVLTMAFSSITGRLLTSFVGFGIDDKYMTAAAVMSIPTAFAYSKLCYPETRGAAMSAESLLQVPREKSVVEAAVGGAVLGLYLITCCVGNIVTYMSLSRFANTMFDWGTSNLGFETATLEGTLSFIISPLALLIGVPREDCKAVGNLIAVKILHSERAAYQRLGVTDLLERSQMMAKFSLCGVGNLSILGMVMGAMFVLCPDRATAVASMILRVFLTCAGAALLMACVAGSLLD